MLVSGADAQDTVYDYALVTFDTYHRTVSVEISSGSATLYQLKDLLAKEDTADMSFFLGRIQFLEGVGWTLFDTSANSPGKSKAIRHVWVLRKPVQ